MPWISKRKLEETFGSLVAERASDLVEIRASQLADERAAQLAREKFWPRLYDAQILANAVSFTLTRTVDENAKLIAGGEDVKMPDGPVRVHRIAGYSGKLAVAVLPFGNTQYMRFGHAEYHPMDTVYTHSRSDGNPGDRAVSGRDILAWAGYVSTINAGHNPAETLDHTGALIEEPDSMKQRMAHAGHLAMKDRGINSGAFIAHVQSYIEKEMLLSDQAVLAMGQTALAPEVDFDALGY